MNDRLDAQPSSGCAPGQAILHRILVPLDGSRLAECTLPHAIALARAFAAEVVLLRVVGNSGPAQQRLHAPSVEWRLQHLEAERYLAKIGAEVQSNGVRVAQQTAVGRASEHILAVARSAHVDLIVLSTHGVGGLTRFKLSGTASKVLSSAECSVLLVCASETAAVPPRAAAYERVIVPLDGSQRGDWAACVAAPLARASGAELVLVCVVLRPELIGAAGPDSEAYRLADRIVEVNTAAARAHLEQQCAALAAAHVRVRWRIEGDSSAGQVIDHVAEQEAASLIVVSAHGHAPGTGWPYGAVVGTLLAYGTRPILVLQDVPQRVAAQPPRSLPTPPGRRSRLEAM